MMSAVLTVTSALRPPGGRRKVRNSGSVNVVSWVSGVPVGDGGDVLAAGGLDDVRHREVLLEPRLPWLRARRESRRSLDHTSLGRGVLRGDVRPELGGAHEGWLAGHYAEGTRYPGHAHSVGRVRAGAGEADAFPHMLELP